MSPATRFVIVNNGRSGSTLLVDLLRSHPAIDCQHELLNENRWRGWQRPVGWLVRQHPLPYLTCRAWRSDRSVFGFKLKTGEQVHHLERTLRSLQRCGWRLICLRRRDALQQALSWCVARASGRWQAVSRHPRGKEMTITLEVEEFMRDLRTCDQDRRLLDDLMSRLPHLPLAYEDDLQNSQQWTATGITVCDWLGVAPAPLSSQMIKTWDRPYSEMVSNYREILAAVAAGSFHDLVVSPAGKTGSDAGHRL